MINTKLDLKKVNKELFNVKEGEYKKVICDKAYYIAINGEGDPNNNADYIGKVSSLYKVAYKLKFQYKKEGLDFVVMPLSGLWWAEDNNSFVQGEKKLWKWTMMIQLPDYIKENHINNIKSIFNEDELYSSIKDIEFIEYIEGEAYETLYIGSYKNEGDTVKKLHKTIKENGYKLRGKHHEIYLNDPRKTDENKLKTIIRQGIEV